MGKIIEHTHFSAYYEHNNKVTASNLLVFGYEIYKKATIIEKFDIYQNIPYSKDSPPDITTLNPFIVDCIVDHIRIIICFENYMKAVLLSNHYVIHRISDKKKELKKLQNEKPIKVDQVFLKNSFKDFYLGDLKECNTTSNTITFSCLLKDEYQKIINLPTDINLIIKNLNEQRNKLHFINEKDFRFGKASIEKYAKIIDFVENIIKPYIYCINKELDTIRKLKNLSTLSTR